MIERNGKTIAISAEEFEQALEQLKITFQNKTILWNGENKLVTTVLQELFEMASGKINIILANELPETTTPNTQYWVLTYDGHTLDNGRYIILTDNLNVATYIGTSDVDLSNYYTKAETDNKFQEKITDSDETSALSDSSKFSLVSASGKTNKKWTFTSLWNWISSKLTSLLDAKADKATTLSGYGITNAYTKTETDTKLDAKLNLSGGTMTGAIITKNGTGFKRDVDNDALALYGGTDYKKGAYIQLSGKDRSSLAGGFTLAATNGTTTKYFQGKPDGTLNWDGVSLMPVHYTGDSVMTISNIASQGLSNGADYASNVTRRIIKVGKMVYFTCHIKWTAVAVGKAWTTVGTIASAFKPSFNRPTIVGMVYNNGLNEACGGNIDTTGVIQVWTNDKTAGNNYQIRLSGFWTVD